MCRYVFSALCHTALQLFDRNTLEKLFDWARNGELLLSDSMPWREKDCYLPKPFYLGEERKELPAGQKKKMKKLAWISVRDFPRFLESVRGGTLFEPSGAADRFGVHTEVTRAAVQDGRDAVPYRIGVYQFENNCGLYEIAAAKTQEQEAVLLSLFQALGMGGIGGKISSGYGKFHLEDVVLLNEFFDAQTQWLYESLTAEKERSVLLSASLPREEELEQALEGATYQLVRRGGFVASDTYAETPQKKKTQYFFRSGSVFGHRFTGDLYSVGGFGEHPVYRYAKPMFLGVDL